MIVRKERVMEFSRELMNEFKEKWMRVGKGVKSKRSERAIAYD